ncbi:cytosine permease [Streptomyces sp. NPDC046821]|uniref:cytosine permease n=1 Tax=Streptomyces sp. NPDC046821 TaxID=3154702 RepID=UPI0033D841FF
MSPEDSPPPCSASRPGRQRWGSPSGTCSARSSWPLHSAQGPRLGVPQMVQTKGQFGSWGALLVVLIVVVMYLGFFISILVFGGQSLASVIPHLSSKAGIVLLAAASIAATIWGYNLIHAYARIMTYASGAVLLLAFVWAFVVHPVPHTFFSSGQATLSGFLSREPA